MTASFIAQAWPYLIGLVALFGLYQRGKHDGAVKATREVMDRYIKTAKAVNNADLGIGASDSDRIERLREFENKR